MKWESSKRLGMGWLAWPILPRKQWPEVNAEARIPSAVIYKAPDNLLGTSNYFVRGLASFLAANSEDERFITRIKQHDSLRAYLTGLGDGFQLEALAAAVLREEYSDYYATRKSNDQGVDCFASRPILQISSWCSRSDMLPEISKIGERLHVVASCKANEGNVANQTPRTINPSQIREVIGAWLIQRADSGMWKQRAGVKFLSPLQLLLVTTYRLSADSYTLCRDMGVAVWGIPELIYLICRFAPDRVFGQGSFNSVELKRWSDEFDNTRVEVA